MGIGRENKALSSDRKFEDDLFIVRDQNTLKTIRNAEWDDFLTNEIGFEGHELDEINIRI